VVWLLATVEALSQAKASREFVKSSKVGNTAFIAQCGSNTHGRFLAVAEYGGSGRKSLVVILEGRGGSSWRGFAVELRKFLGTFIRPMVLEAERSSGFVMVLHPHLAWVYSHQRHCCKIRLGPLVGHMQRWWLVQGSP
jgi:hypothetical protein